jgi:hypothetical protein
MAGDKPDALTVGTVGLTGLGLLQGLRRLLGPIVAANWF